MQLMIDVYATSPARLRALAEFLITEADRPDRDADQWVPLIPDSKTIPVRVVSVPAGPTAAEAFGAQTMGQATVRAEGARPVHIPAPPPVNVVPPPPVAPPSPGADAAAGGTTPFIPPAPTTVLPSGGPVDADGFPHDKRIHSEIPKTNADGRWRTRRNLDNAILTAVEAELRSMGYGVKTPSSPGNTVPVIPPPPPPVIPAPPSPMVIVAPVIPSPPAPASDPFRQLMAHVTPHTGSGGRLALDIMKPIHAEFGASGWADYVHLKRDQIPALMARIELLLKA